MYKPLTPEMNPNLGLGFYSSVVGDFLIQAQLHCHFSALPEYKACHSLSGDTHFSPQTCALHQHLGAHLLHQHTHSLVCVLPPTTCVIPLTTHVLLLPVSIPSLNPCTTSPMVHTHPLNLHTPRSPSLHAPTLINCAPYMRLHVPSLITCTYFPSL